MLAGRPVDNESDQRAPSEYLSRTVRTPFPVTGGRMARDRHLLDVFRTGSGPMRSRDTGCGGGASTDFGDALSASVAARNVTGTVLIVAIADARAWVSCAITRAAAWTMTRGEGTIDHFGWT